MIRGIDVSHYNTIAWAAMKRANVGFGFAKATEGIAFVDPKWRQNVKGMRAQGILAGGYHWLLSDTGHNDGGDRQAEHFANTLGNLDDLRCAVDLERTNRYRIKPGWFAETCRYDDLVAFVKHWDQITGGHPLICYSNPAGLAMTVGLHHDLHALGFDALWTAYYSRHDVGFDTVGDPRQLPGWSGYAGFPRTDILQWTSTGRVAGVSTTGGLDLDFYRGTVDELVQLAQPRVWVPIPERPNYRLGWNTLLEAYVGAIQLMGAPAGPAGPAYPAGAAAVRDAALEALGALEMVEEP